MSDVEENDVEEQEVEEVPEGGVEPESPTEGGTQEEEPDYKALYEKEKEIHENLNIAVSQEREEKKHWRDLVKDQQEPKPQQESKSPEIADDDYPTWGQVKQVLAQQQQVQLQAAQKQQEHSMAVNVAEATMRSEYPDYDETAKLGIEELKKTYNPQQLQQMYFQNDPHIIPRMLYGIGESVKNKTVKAQENKDTANALVNRPSQPKSAGVRGSKSSAKTRKWATPEDVPLEKWDEYVNSLSEKEKEEYGLDE